MAQSKKNSKGRNAARIIAWILIILLLIGAIVAILHFTNDGNEGFKTFYLIHDGKDIVTTHSYAYYETGEQRFDVKYTFDVVSDEPRDYNVKIVPNTDADFDFTVEERWYSWASADELNGVFGLKKEADHFTFTIPEDKSITSVLEKMFPGEAVTAPSEAELPSPYLYSLIVSSYNEEVSYKIDFSIVEIIAIEQVVIECEDLIF